MKDDHVETFHCLCSSAEHTLNVRYLAKVKLGGMDFPPELYIEVHLASLPFLKRLLAAFWYVLGRKSRQGCFEEFLLDPKDTGRLTDMILGFEDALNPFQEEETES